MVKVGSGRHKKMNASITAKAKQIPDMSREQLDNLKQEIESANDIDDKTKFYLYDSIGKRQEILDITKEKC